MDEQTLAAIEANPIYRQLVRERSRLGWTLAVLVLIAFFGFTLLVAFDKQFLAQPIGSGVTSLGIPVGFGIILLSIALTLVYVIRANGRYDRMTRQLLTEIGR